MPKQPTREPVETPVDPQQPDPATVPGRDPVDPPIQNPGDPAPPAIDDPPLPGFVDPPAPGERPLDPRVSGQRGALADFGAAYLALNGVLFPA